MNDTLGGYALACMVVFWLGLMTEHYDASAVAGVAALLAMALLAGRQTWRSLRGAPDGGDER